MLTTPTATHLPQPRLPAVFRTWRRPPWLPHVLLLLSYLPITFYYMTPQMLHCQTVVYGFGDNTGGPIWRFSVYPSNPLWGFEHVTNYPYGESLSSPIWDSAALEFSFFWVLAKIAGPICGYNIFNIVGFIGTAAAMYGFIFWLTRRKSLAWLAGYAVSFAPYFQYKVGGHPSYGYAALLILAIWFFFRLLRERRKWDMVILALAVAACFYWDPYFSLLIATVVAPLVGVTIAYDVLISHNRSHPLALAKEVWARLRPFAVSALLILVAMLPLAVIAKLSASQISATVFAPRGDSLWVATICGNTPTDYLIPSDNNFFADLLTYGGYSRSIVPLRHGCNSGEDNVGLSLTLLGVVAAAAVIFVRMKQTRRRLDANVPAGFDYQWITLALGGVLAAGFVMGLPAFPNEEPTLGYYLLQVTQTWRVLAREFVVVNIALVALAMIALLVLAQRWLRQRPRLRVVLFGLLFLTIFIQYQPFTPFTGSGGTRNFATDTPPIYVWLRDQADIQHIAEYPFGIGNEANGIGIYLSMQLVDKKQLLNSVLQTSPQEPLRYAIWDLTAPQTLPVLRGLGIDAVVVHGVSAADVAAVPGLQVLRTEPVDRLTGNSILVAKILPGPTQDYALTLKQGFPFKGVIMVSSVNVQYEAMNLSQMQLTPLSYDPRADAQHTVCFDVKMASPDDADHLSVLVNGVPVISDLPVGGQYVPVRFLAQENQVITLRNDTTHDMRLDNLGCQ